MMLMPLAALPYPAAWLVWSCVLYGLYALLLRRLVRSADRYWLMLLAPGAAVNLFFGQNGLLTLVLMGGGVFLLPRRPALAGILLGLLAYKPQFALLAPLGLVAGREWRALAWAVVSQAALALLAAAVLGSGAWLEFLHKAAEPASVFTSSSSNWRAIPSVMILARTLGLGAAASAVCHWVVAAAAATGALFVWWKTKDSEIRAAALATATLLVTPYLRGYDMILLLLSILPLINKRASSLLEKTAIALAWLLPAVLMFSNPPIQFAPFISLALMIMIFRLPPDILPKDR
jgi:hypothetical protein